MTGLLSAVGSLMMTVQNSTISLNWTAPFTLDIAGVDPDITYCVSVVNSTSSSTLHSQCGITEAGFSFSIPPDSACHNYTFTFTVTPVNAVGNGTSSMYYHNLQGDCYHAYIVHANALWEISLRVPYSREYKYPSNTSTP